MYMIYILIHALFILVKILYNLEVRSWRANFYKILVSIFGGKELSLRNKIKYLNLNIFRTECCKPLIFQTNII